MFDLYQLRQLVTVAERGSLSAAAKTLNLSQPALTRSMQRLEEALGVPLFDRAKNKIMLNEAGRLAVEQAKGVLAAAEGMERRLRDYARSLRTIAVGSCAPGPMWALTPLLMQRFSDKTISAELAPPDTLLDGLLSDRYQLVVTDAPAESDGIVCREYRTERLSVSLPGAHPLAKKRGIRLRELAGQTMLLYSDLGVWQKLCEEKMRGVRFIVQTDREAFADLVSASVLPSFTTDLVGGAPPPGRVAVPILDPGASITFWLCATEKRARLLDAVD